MSRLKFFTFVSFLSFSLDSIAQANNMYLGPDGGPGLAIIYGKNSGANQGRNPLAAGTAGYAFQYNFTKIFSIRTDLSYERAGAYYIIPLNPGPPPNYSDRIKMDYLTLPVLARASFGKKINFFIDAGPYFGVLLRELDVVKVDPSPKVVTNNTSSYKRFDTGISEGIGFLIPLGNSFGLSFEARNNAGLYYVSNPFPGIPNLGIPASVITAKTNTTNFIFAFIYKLVTKKPAAKQKT